jgi:NAD(P)-dependent dehydrogenase (short-subunit alcohol dehydrogenase family)
MDTGLKGKNVLITGASRNMGSVRGAGVRRRRCQSRDLHEREDEGVEPGCRGRAQAGVKVVAREVRCDRPRRRHLVRQGGARSAGQRRRGRQHRRLQAENPFLETSFEEWNRAIDVNLTGPYYVCQQAIPSMIERGWGRVINISGISPYLGGGATKSMVKLGIVGFTRGLAKEFAKHGITANCIGPGAIARAERDPGDHERELHSSQPVRRLGQPEDITTLMLHLAGENSGFITGQCYLVNGGMYFQ